MKFYVATRVHYVLVEADDEPEARTRAEPMLKELVTHNFPIEIHTVRHATADEIHLWDWHHEMVDRHTND
ncbi:hypothetical protein [Thalassoglobus sp.]|uniref:hypothetical protein n=1 Tax=Thalassoglobus sp. TaxID=2795869 RepID=UPI003AA88E1A